MAVLVRWGGDPSLAPELLAGLRRQLPGARWSSVSRTRTRCVVAVSDEGAVGVDAEDVRPFPMHRQLLARLGEPPDAGEGAALRAWVGFEAGWKCAGSGVPGWLEGRLLPPGIVVRELEAPRGAVAALALLPA